LKPYHDYLKHKKHKKQAEKLMFNSFIKFIHTLNVQKMVQDKWRKIGCMHIQL